LISTWATETANLCGDAKGDGNAAFSLLVGLLNEKGLIVGNNVM
jgi:hypothetical protein